MNKLKNKINKLSLVVLALFLFASSSVFANEINSFYVKDKSSYINTDIKNHISNINKYYESTKEKPQVVVEIIKSLEGKDIESYAYNRFEKLEIGNKEYDNGVLVVASIEDKKFRIEVGYGLEGALTDSESKDILDSSVSYFKDEKYSEGVKNIFDGVVENINEEYEYTNVEAMGDVSYIGVNNEDSELTQKEKVIIGAVAVVVIILMIVSPGFREFVFYVVIDALLDSDGGSSSSGRSSSSSGGGGRSGGGGASGGW